MIIFETHNLNLFEQLEKDFTTGDFHKVLKPKKLIHEMEIMDIQEVMDILIMSQYSQFS